MSSSFVKSKLKAARDALGKKQYEAARDAACQVLDYEPDNYNAYVYRAPSYRARGLTWHSHVFLGLAHLELGELDKSEQVNRRMAPPVIYKGADGCIVISQGHRTEV